MRALLTECGDLQIAFLDLISARLRQFVGLVHSLAFRDVAARLATELLLRAEIEGQTVGSEIHIDRILTQQELAATVGTAREVVYRVFKRFERDGVARLTRQQIIILDPTKLSHIARKELR